MTRRVNLKGSRLGISNKWSNQSVGLNYKSLVGTQYFIQNLVEGFLKKWNLGLLFLDIKIEQNIVNVDIIVQNKLWDDLRSKGKKIKKRYKKKQRQNHVRLVKLRKEFLSVYFNKKKRFAAYNLFKKCSGLYWRSYNMFFYLHKYNISPNHQKQLLKILSERKAILHKAQYTYYKYKIESKRLHSLFLKKVNKYYSKTKYLNFSNIVFTRLVKLFLEKRIRSYLHGKYFVKINIFTVNELIKKYKYVARNTEIVYNDSKFHKYKKWYGKNFFDYILILNLGLFFQRPKYITDFIGLLLRYNRRHSSTCYMVFDLLNTLHYYYSNVKSLKLAISGRFHGKIRKEKRIFQTEGSLQSQTLDLPLDYGFSEAYTYCGVFGIKLWMLKEKAPLSGVELRSKIEND